MFLASDESSSATGVHLEMDGGMKVLVIACISLPDHPNCWSDRVSAPDSGFIGIDDVQTAAFADDSFEHVARALGHNGLCEARPDKYPRIQHFFDPWKHTIIEALIGGQAEE